MLIKLSLLHRMRHEKKVDFAKMPKCLGYLYNLET